MFICGVSLGSHNTWWLFPQTSLTSDLCERDPSNWEAIFKILFSWAWRNKVLQCSEWSDGCFDFRSDPSGWCSGTAFPLGLCSEVLGLNLGWDTGYPKNGFSGFPRSIEAWLLHSKLFIWHWQRRKISEKILRKLEDPQVGSICGRVFEMYTTANIQRSKCHSDINCRHIYARTHSDMTKP
jgi:hypothetical protein